ncbi:hypothetical protein ARMGADRAFT_577275 [Armillaria gallica]|uniref:Uncharacterized protein n=1 Tax=Armillaria gallica TaxID=47427 RepID=A0A2H3EDD7_ARMGA|nr:hypothetical protein ARMGADRAFT_577275 [Armillaria gallica]
MSGSCTSSDLLTVAWLGNFLYLIQRILYYAQLSQDSDMPRPAMAHRFIETSRSALGFIPRTHRQLHPRPVQCEQYYCLSKSGLNVDHHHYRLSSERQENSFIQFCDLLKLGTYLSIPR